MELYSRLAGTELFDYDHPQVRFGPCVNAEKEMNGHHTMEPFVLIRQLLQLIVHTQGKVWPFADNKYSTVIIHTISKEKLSGHKIKTKVAVTSFPGCPGSRF